MYSEGIGVKQDFGEAIKWYEKAVNNGFGPSANNLGLLYKNGQGVKPSQEQAFKYFKLAADRGDTPGMQNLADCYRNGEGTGSYLPTENDLSEGIIKFKRKTKFKKFLGKKWLNRAVEKGDMLAEKQLEEFENIPSAATLMNKIMSPNQQTDPLDYERFGKAVNVNISNTNL